MSGRQLRGWREEIRTRNAFGEKPGGHQKQGVTAESHKGGGATTWWWHQQLINTEGVA